MVNVFLRVECRALHFLASKLSSSRHSQLFSLDVTRSVSLCSPGSFCLGLQSRGIMGAWQHHRPVPPCTVVQCNLLPARTLLPCFCRCYSKAHSCTEDKFFQQHTHIETNTGRVSQERIRGVKSASPGSPCGTWIVQMNHEACAEHAASGCCGGKAGFR